MAKNGSILSQKVPKFELYKHNDELFNIYYGIFLWSLNFCPFWPIMQIRKKGGWNLKNFFSETTEPILTKLCWNDPWVVPFQNCVRWSRLPTKMAAKLKIEKRGMKFKKSSPMKLLWQSQPSFAEMILGWSISKIMSGISDLLPRWPPQPNLI